MSIKVNTLNYFSKQQSKQFYINAAKVETKGKVRNVTISKSNSTTGRKRVNNFKSIIDQKF